MITTTIREIAAEGIRKETDSVGVVEVPGDKLWGAQTQPTRAFQHRQGLNSRRNDYGVRHFEEGRSNSQTMTASGWTISGTS